MRHVLVLTATGSVGLMAIFVVDFLNLFYIALLGEQELAAAIGYAGTALFFTTSLCIGVSIAATALVSRALGAGERGTARRLAGSSLVFMLVVTAAVSLAMLPLLRPTLGLLGAEGRTLDIAVRFLTIVLPSTPLLGLSMACAGLLRAAGDARRSMYVTLSSALVTAALDPVLIFGFGLGVDGAAVVSVVSRVVMTAVGFAVLIRVHDLLQRPSVSAAVGDAPALAAIAAPAVLANVATPVANAYVTAAIAPFGDSAVAGFAIIGRVVPLAFGAIFALSGSVGPIIGQNLGARRYDRLQQTVRDSLTFTVVYCFAMWAILALLREPIISLFGATAEGADLIRFFCMYMAGTFVFLGALFVANAAFNNLGFAGLSTLFNWGRATLGTVPLVALGARHYGPEGALAGQALGGMAFGIAAVAVCFWRIRLLEGRAPPAAAPAPLQAPDIPPFASEKAATALDWGEADGRRAGSPPPPT